MNINEISKKIHQNAVDKQFWEENYNLSEKLMLVVSEIAEAQEADRKNRYTVTRAIVNVNNIPADEAFKNSFEATIKDTFEDEIADAVIRLLDMAQKKGFDLEQHITAKMRYNAMRPVKHGKKY